MNSSRHLVPSACCGRVHAARLLAVAQITVFIAALEWCGYNSLSSTTDSQRGKQLAQGHEANGGERHCYSSSMGLPRLCMHPCMALTMAGIAST